MEGEEGVRQDGADARQPQYESCDGQGQRSKRCVLHVYERRVDRKSICSYGVKTPPRGAGKNREITRAGLYLLVMTRTPVQEASGGLRTNSRLAAR